MSRDKQTELFCREKEKPNVQGKIHGENETVGVTDFFLISDSSHLLGLIMIFVLGFSDIILYSYNKVSFPIFGLCFCYLPWKEFQLPALCILGHSLLHVVLDVPIVQGRELEAMDMKKKALSQIENQSHQLRMKLEL